MDVTPDNKENKFKELDVIHLDSIVKFKVNTSNAYPDYIQLNVETKLRKPNIDITFNLTKENLETMLKELNK